MNRWIVFSSSRKSSDGSGVVGGRRDARAGRWMPAVGEGCSEAARRRSRRVAAADGSIKRFC